MSKMSIANITRIFKRHKVLLISLLFFFFMVFLYMFVSGSKKQPVKEIARPLEIPTVAVPPVIPPTWTPIIYTFEKPTGAVSQQMSPALKEAIEKQLAADEEYADMQLTIKNNYQWINDLPLQSQNYFVYFDIKKNYFVGQLYPSAGESTETLKVEILQKLKNRKILIESFGFEWVVSE